MAVDRVRLGGWLSMTDPLIVETAGRAGFDWVGIDLQHGAWDLGSAIRGIQLLDLLNVPVLVRVVESELHLIPHALDQGAAGIIVAMTSGPAPIADAVARARYQPEGRRSYGGQRYGLRAEAADVASIRPAVHAMIEGRQAVDQIGAITAMRGLAGIHVGPVDLCLDLGIGGDRSHPSYLDALHRIVTASRAAGLPAVMHAVRTEQVASLIRMGFNELVLTADIELLRAAFAESIASARTAAHCST
jgi:2-keto-3-deoxy-L-rhamnonate aldolase RhmA